MKIPTFSKRVLNELGPIRKVLGWPWRGIPYHIESPWDFVRGGGPAPERQVTEPRLDLPPIEYPTLPEPYELPEPQAWFDGFHVPRTADPFALPEIKPAFALGDNVEPVLAEFSPALDGPPEPLVAGDNGMLEVAEAIDQARASELRGGLEGQVGPAPGFENVAMGLEHLVRRHDAEPEPFPPLPPGLPL